MKNKIYLFIILFGLGILAVKLLDIKAFWQISWQWIEHLGFLGYLLFILIYNLGTLFFIPGSILTIKGGCLYGLFLGTIIVLTAAILGATLSFLLGRYYCRDWVNHQLEKYPILQKIDHLVAKEGWKIVFLTRLCPLFPFNFLNYFFGVTEITLRDYILGSLAIFPGTFMYVYIGSIIRDLTNYDLDNYATDPNTQTLIWSIRFLGLISTIILTIYSVQIAKKTLNQNILNGD